MVEAEQADTVGHLFPDAIETLEICHGLLIAHGFEGVQVQPSPRRILTEADNVFSPVAKL